jgi:hypothetical protein
MIRTNTDTSLPDISRLDILQSGTDSAHSNHAEVLDDYTLSGVMLAQSTEEAQHDSTMLIHDFTVLFFLRSLPGFPLPELFVANLAATSAQHFGDSACPFTFEKSHGNLTAIHRTSSSVVTPQATEEAQKSITHTVGWAIQYSALKGIRLKTLANQKAKEKTMLKKSYTHGAKYLKRDTLMINNMTLR